MRKVYIPSTNVNILNNLCYSLSYCPCIWQHKRVIFGSSSYIFTCFIIPSNLGKSSSSQALGHRPSSCSICVIGIRWVDLSFSWVWDDDCAECFQRPLIDGLIMRCFDPSCFWHLPFFIEGDQNSSLWFQQPELKSTTPDGLNQVGNLNIIIPTLRLHFCNNVSV